MLTKRFTEDIELIENSLHGMIERIEDPIVREEAKRLILAGGKRIRPLFLLWASRMGSVTHGCYTAAASLELLHTASLIHDDIIDDAPVRRGHHTTMKIYGRERATSIGTVLSLFAIDRIATMNNTDISHDLAHTLEKLCLGEIKQLKERYFFQCTYEDYLEKITNKTASLMALPCKIGAILGGLDKGDVEKLYRLGYNIGCSFQILDDIMDIESSEEVAGKSCGLDLKSGIITLPYLLLMEQDDSFKEKIMKLTPGSPEEEFNLISETLRSSQAIDEAYRISNYFLDKASCILSTMPHSKSRESFSFIVDSLYKKSTISERNL